LLFHRLVALFSAETHRWFTPIGARSEAEAVARVLDRHGERTQVGTGAAAGRVGDLMGYARVSTRDHTLALQPNALQAARREHTFEETASGEQREWP